MHTPNEPLHYEVQPPPRLRNRLTVGFRPLLALPHALLVGSPVLVGIGAGAYRTGALGLLALGQFGIGILAGLGMIATGVWAKGLAAFSLMKSFLSSGS